MGSGEQSNSSKVESRTGGAVRTTDRKLSSTHICGEKQESNQENGFQWEPKAEEQEGAASGVAGHCQAWPSGGRLKGATPRSS